MQAYIVNIFPRELRSCLQKMDDSGLEEIRIRIGLPVEFIYDSRSEWLRSYDAIITRQRLDEMLNYITGYSLYAMEEELRQGYISMAGGHRIGITGHATYKEFDKGGQQVMNLVDIGGLNIRIAHEKKDCARELIPHLRNGPSIYNTLFFAAPGAGKTTYLRDAVRILATGDESHRGIKCCVVDERSEIAACIQGKPQNDLGQRCDVLDACPKLLGMKMVLRSMSPEIIVVDELGKEEEFALLEEMRCCGVGILGTMHAGTIEEILHNPFFKKVMKNHTIDRLVELRKMDDGTRKFQIFNGQGEVIWEKS